MREAQRAVDRGTLAWWQVALVSAIAFAIALGLLDSIGKLFRPLVLLTLAVVIASAVEPAVKWLARRVPRALASLIVYLIIVAAFGALAWWAIPRIVSQAVQVIRDLPDLVTEVRETLAWWTPGSNNAGLDLIAGAVGGFAGALASLPLTIMSMALDIVLVFILSIYWSVFIPNMHRVMLSLFPVRQRDRAGTVVREMGEVMGGFVRAVVIDAAVVGAIVYVALLIIGVPFAMLLSLIAAAGEIIPVVGPFIGGGAAVTVAFLESPDKALIVLIFYLVLQQIESNILVPLIVHRTASIPPPLGIFALMAGAAVGGPIVAITAIPISGALYVLTLRVLIPAIQHWTGADADPLPDEDEQKERQDKDHATHASDALRHGPSLPRTTG